MAGFDIACFDTVGELSVDGFDLVTPAWWITNLPKLWFEYEVRGDNVVLPGAPGQRSYPRRLDQSEHELTLYVDGGVDSGGVEYANPWTGLMTNLDSLYANVFSPIGSGRGTRPAVLTLPDGVTTRTADVQFTPLRGTDDIEDPRFVVFRTTMTVPAGRFT